MKNLVELFRGPSSQYRCAPFWSLNDELEEQELRRQIREFHRAGMGGFFMHARPGLMTPYMEEPWLKAIAACIDEARLLGMEAWLYDEDKWPSGFAGGKVIEAAPQLTAIFLNYIFLRPGDPEPDGAVAVFGLGDVDETREETDAKDASPLPRADRLAFVEVTASPSSWHNNTPYVDLRDPKTMEVFAATTHDPYAKRFGADFGGIVPGVFTDEPHGVPSLRDSLPWTRGFLDIFTQEKGYDLAPELLSLLYPVGEWRRIRFDFWSLMNTLFVDNFGRAYFEWCEAHGLQLTGHYWEHAFPGPYVDFAPMPLYLYMQRPGIDCLFNQFESSPLAAESARQFGKARIVKEPASIAAQTGRRKVLCEAYGGSGWELSFADQKRNGDWLYVLGVNYLCQHLSHYSLRGHRKTDFPLSFLDHQPWWPQYRALNDYFARLSVILSHGETRHRIAVLHPATSAWALYSPVDENRALTALDQRFEHLTRVLLGMHFGFDFVDEQVLAEIGTVENGTLVVGREHYSTLVIPEGAANLNVHTFRMLKEFLGEGGHLVRFDDAPTLVDGEPSDDLARFMDYPEIVRITPDPRALEYTLETTARRDLSISQDGREIMDVYCQVRDFKNRTFYFVVNANADEGYSARLVLRNGYDVEEWGPLDGTVKLLHGKESWGPCQLDLRLDPGQSCLLAVTHEPSNAPTAEPKFHRVVESIPVDHLTGRRLNRNVAVLDRCQFKLASVDLWQGPVPIHEAAAAVYAHHDLKIGYHHTQPWTWVHDKRELPDGTGFSLSFEFGVAEGFQPANLFLVVESGEFYDVAVNGRPAHADGGWWLDRRFKQFAVAPLVRAGRNEIVLTCAPMRKDVEPDACFLTGDFAVYGYEFVSEPTLPSWYQHYPQAVYRFENGPLIGPNEPIAPGDWILEGMPFYSGTVRYSGTVDLDGLTQARQVRLALNGWQGVVATIHLNGRDAGFVAWPPNHLDVTQFVLPGRNDIEIDVISSLRNTLGPLHARSLDGFVHPGLWTAGEGEGALPDTEYLLQRHGLLKPPVVEILER